VGCTRLRQHPVGSDDTRRHLICFTHLGAALRRFGEIRPGAAVAVDDPCGEQVVHDGAGPWLITAKQIVKAEVLADDDDQVLDRGGCSGRRLGAGNGAEQRQHRQ